MSKNEIGTTRGAWQTQRMVEIKEEEEQHVHTLPEGTGSGGRKRFLVVEEYDEGVQQHPEHPATFKCGTPYACGLPRKERHDYWSELLKPLQAHDRAQCKIWEDEVQNILIFASLFSAVVTAFIVESYKNLKPDPNDVTVILLTRIVARLDSVVNGSTSPLPDEPIAFTPSSISVNVFWILSLVFSLTTVLIGIVASQWLREHQLHPDHFSAEERFALLSMRTEMIEKWHIPAFFVSLPVLLELALVLFFLGLAEFLRSLNVRQVTVPIIVAISLSLLFLVATTAIPALQVLTVRSTRSQVNKNVPIPCPYKSPQAQLFRLLVSSRLGNLFARYTAIPIYSIVTQSVRGTRSLDVSGVLWLYLSPLLRPFRTESFRKRLRKARAFITHPVAFFRGRRREGRADHEVYQPSYPDYNPVNARSWTDLDMEWVSLRRHYSSQTLIGWHWSPLDGRFQKGLQYGPLYDHLLGIQQVCSRHRHYPAILHSAYHCFVDCISTEDMKPGQPSLDRTSRRFGDDYYKSVIEMLRLHGTLVISDIVRQPPSPDLMYDEAVLLFVERFVPVPQATKTELINRTLNHVSDNSGTWEKDKGQQLKGLAFDRSRMYSVSLHKSFFKLGDGTDGDSFAADYAQSFFQNIADKKMDWTAHQIFVEDLRGVVGNYLRFCSDSITPRDSEVIERAVSTLKANLYCHLGPTPLPQGHDPEPMQNTDNRNTHSFLGAWAVVDAYMMNHRHRQASVPRGVLELAATFKNVASDMISHPLEPRNKNILQTTCQIFGKNEVYVLRELEFHRRRQESILGRLYEPVSAHHTRIDNPPEVAAGPETGPSSAFPMLAPASPSQPSPPKAGQSTEILNVEATSIPDNTEGLVGKDTLGAHSKTKVPRQDEYDQAEAGVLVPSAQ